jgi:multiple sugar transport system permease protein
MNGRPHNSLVRAEARFAYVTLIPVLIYMIIFVLVPVFTSLLYSFLNTRRGVFIGLENYFEYIFEDPKGIGSFFNVFRYALIRIPLTIIPGFFISNALNNIRKGRSLLIAGFFAPYITSMVAYSTLFIYIFNNIGLINTLLRAMGLPAQGFIRDVKQALPSIAIMDAFKHIGFDVVIFLSAFQSIPETLYEAARIDGASNREITFKIKMPLLRPTFLYLIVVITIWTLQVFEPIYVMTGGGPLNSTRSVVLSAYQAAFADGRLGYGSAITMLLFILIFLITLVQLRIGKTDFSY